MHGSVHGWCMVWYMGGGGGVGDVGVDQMHVSITWIGEVGLEHWGRSGWWW